VCSGPSARGNRKRKTNSPGAPRDAKLAMRPSRLCTVTTLLATFTLLVCARADSVTLTDGKVFQGTFVEAAAGHITLQIDGRSKRRFKLDQIVSIHFDHAEPGASLSPIEKKYRALMNSAHPLGNPSAEEQETADQRGRYRKYQNGVIYYTPQTGAFAMQGMIAERWLSLGAERSELGYPTADEVIWPDGRHVMLFEHGAVFWDGREEPVVEIRAH